MAKSSAAKFFGFIGLRSAKTSILALVLAWLLHVLWLGLNYFWSFASVQVLLAVPVLLLTYAVTALVAYIYWGVREVQEKDVPYANVMVGVIVAITLLYFNYTLLEFVLEAIE
ncbi:MAG: hypothetical protein LPK07_15485 [Hymenobacteraceae bacterium]|nr:hypothetical protein [Hymenobacteraceae bacterium]